jgi:hypothetical protein
MNMNKRFFIDFEFNGMGGDLISAGITRQDGHTRYYIDDGKIEELVLAKMLDPWVEENVLPILYATPHGVVPFHMPSSDWGAVISDFIYCDGTMPTIYADWMSDIADLMNLFITGPGTAVPMGDETHLVCLRHLDVYPTTLSGAVQHNAAWDALALRHWYMNGGWS